MSASQDSLFRPEALARRGDGLEGSVNIALPVAWHVIGTLLFLGLVAVILFLWQASYSRVETVPGVLALDSGVALIVPSRGGVVTTISVTEGQNVRAGDKLATVRAEESMIAGASAPTRVRDALGQQDAQLAAQGNLLLKAAVAEQASLKAQIVGDMEALPQLESQISDQRQMVATADADYRNAVEVAKRGFLTEREIDDRQTTLLSRRQQLAQLQQLLSSKRAEIARAQKAVTQSAMTASAQMANAQSGRAGLSQQLAQADLAQGYAITSPVDGVVTAITARLGQPAIVDQQLMQVVPARSQLRVELYVPTSAIGFVAPKQEVRLSVDAFPYQTFGTIEAVTTNVAAAVVARQTPNGPVPIYLVTASLTKPWVAAFGRRQRLMPGMALSARIVTDKRSLLEWLFEPLFAVRRR